MVQPRRMCRASRSTVLSAARAVVAEFLEPRQYLTTWYVSTTGSASAAGSVSDPFGSIQAAANVAEPGDTVMIHAGTYRETVTPAHSGTASAPITYQPFGDGTVVIDGTEPVSGFTTVGSGIYETSQATTDLGEGNNQVFVTDSSNDGTPTMLFEDRWPASPSLDPTDPVMAHATNIIAHDVGFGNYDVATLTDPALTQAAGFWVGALIHILPGQGWVEQAGRVLTSQSGSLTYEYEQMNTPYEIPTAGNAFYLTGEFGALNSPGEFYRDSSTGDLFVETPDGTDPNNDLVEVKQRQYGFDLANTSYTDIEGLHFFATTVTTGPNTTGDVLNAITAMYVSQETSIADGWSDPASSGIQIRGSDSEIINSYIQFSSGNGIFLLGNDLTAENNTIRDIDYNATDDAGVYVWGSGNTVSYDTIFDAGRDGIHASHSTTTQILHNEIFQVMLQCTDGGGIYTYGTNGAGSRIAYNEFFDIHAGGYHAVGIYLDNYDSNYLVDHNLSFDNDIGIKLNPPSTDEHIYNNTFADNTWDINSSGDLDMSGSVFENNIFSDTLIYGSNAILIDNIYRGTDPDFLNAADGEYTLTAGSPAIDNGEELGAVTAGYVGSAPDIGAYEFGGTPTTFGSTGVGTVTTVVTPAPTPITTLPPTSTPTTTTPGGGLPTGNTPSAPTSSGGGDGPPASTGSTPVVTRDPAPPASVTPTSSLPPGTVPPAGPSAPGAGGSGDTTGSTGSTVAGTVPTVTSEPAPTTGPVYTPTTTPTPTTTLTPTTPTPTPTPTPVPPGSITIPPTPYVPPVTVGNGVSIPVGVVTSPGTVFPVGTVLPVNTSLPSGSVLGPGTIVTSGTNLPLGTNLPAGTVIAPGTVLPYGTVVPYGDVLPAGTIIPAGATLPAGLTISPGQGIPAGLPPGVVLPTGTVIVAGTVLPAGTIITKGTNFPLGTVLPLGTNISEGTSLPAGTVLSPQAYIPAGTVLVKGTVVPQIASLYEKHKRHLKTRQVIATNAYDAANSVTLGAHHALIYDNNGGWAEFNQVNFGKKGARTFRLRFAGDSQYAVRHIEVHVDGVNGPVLGTLSAASTGSESKFRWESTTITSVTGIHDVYLVFDANQGTAAVTAFKLA